MVTSPRSTTEQSDRTDSPVERVLALMRSEWKAGANGRFLRDIQAAIFGLNSLAPAQQTVEAITSIANELRSYRSQPIPERQEQLKRTAERLKAMAIITTIGK